MAKPVSLLLRHQSDRRLAELAAAGHDGAFEVIVVRYRRSLLARARRLVGVDRSEDILQQALLNAHGALRRGDDVADVDAWMHRILANAAISALRSSRGVEEPIEAALPERLAVESAEAAVERRERLREVTASVAQLPARQRDALLLQVGEGRSYEEIADSLQLSGGAVRQLLNRARRSLRAGVTAITPVGLLLRWGAGNAHAATGTATAAGAAGAVAKGGALAVTVLALGGSAATVSSKIVERPEPPRVQEAPADALPDSGHGGAPAKQQRDRRDRRRPGVRAQRERNASQRGARALRSPRSGGSAPAAGSEPPPGGGEPRRTDGGAADAEKVRETETPDAERVDTADPKPPERDDGDNPEPPERDDGDNPEPPERDDGDDPEPPESEDAPSAPTSAD